MRDVEYEFYRANFWHGYGFVIWELEFEMSFDGNGYYGESCYQTNYI